MQQVIEEILRTEEDCARRLEQERRQSEKRRADIESENAERLRAFRSKKEAEASLEMGEYQQRLNEESQAELERAREATRQELAANQILVDRILERIVDIVVRVGR